MRSWSLLHNLGEALEKMLAGHHADLKRAFNMEEEPRTSEPASQELVAQTAAASQTEQVQQARRERRLATFAKVHEL